MTLIVYSGVSAQVLLPTNLNLNVGGVIHDVAYDDYYDAYIVVGDFSTINGQSRNNLAFVDATTLTVLSQAPVTGINGAIRTVEVVNFVPHSGAPGAGFRNYIYLGGNFTTVNTNTKISVARLFSTHYYSQPPAGGLANYSLQTGWDAQFFWDASLGAEYGVHDFHLMGDTLIAVGEFNNVGATYLTGNYNRKTISFDANHPTFLTKNLVFLNGAVDFIASADEPLFGIEQLNDRLFLYGTADNLEIINEYQLDGTFVQQIQNCSTNNSTVYDFEPHPTAIDTILFAYEGASYSAVPYYITSYQNNGSLWNCPGISLTNTILDFPTMSHVNYIESYKDFLFTAGANTTSFFVSKRNGTANVPVLNSFSLNNNWFLNYPNPNGAPCLEVKNNLLFFSTDALSTVSGNSRQGLAVFCLEPTPAESFTQSDASACEEDSSIFTIPQAQCADGYRWSYTGSGAQYRITGSGNPWASLSTVELVGANTNSIEVYYPLGTTGGTLSVEPFTQFSATDRTYSQGQSINITINQKPDILLAPIHTLNCYSDSTFLTVQTTNPNPQFLWSYNNNQNFVADDSLLITINDIPLFDSVYYVMEITDAITGCLNTDSTFFYQDLTADDIDTSLVTVTPNEWTCLSDSMILSANQTGYIIDWEDPTGTYYPDPFTIYAAPNTYYNIHGKQLSNGCTTQIAFGGIPVNTNPADGTLVGYNYQSPSTPIDTINCSNSSIVLQCDVTPPFSSNSVAEWLDDNGVSTGSDILNISQADANGSSFQVFTFRTTNNDNGCTQDYDVLVWFELDIPFVDQIADETLNCSQSDIVLSHPINGLTNITEGWLDGTGVQTGADTLLVFSVGEYYYQVTDTISGCSNVDTVNVTQTLDLDLDMPSDTLICPDEIVSISPIVIGNTETPSYLWSTGSTNATETATGGIDTELSVTVSTPSGCTGSDTTLVLITAPISATITPFVACTDGSIEITSVSGGAGNYQYSLDGTTWQTSTNFPNLVFDDYTISIQDDLGCIYDFNQSLDGTASSVEMQFTASTYNEEGDTIVLVNITDFTGLDSVSWVFPTNANVTYEDDSIVILSIATGGWYDVELIGYIGTDCEYGFIAPIYFGDQAPLFDTTHASNGIQSFVVSPNPTSGSFDVALEFGTLQSYSIVITNMLGQPISSMNVSGSGTIVDHSFTFPVGTVAGTYRIHVISDYDAEQKAIILN